MAGPAQQDIPRPLRQDFRPPLRYDWQTAYWPQGRHYVAKVSDYLTLDVWRRLGGNTWEWAVIGNDMSLPEKPLVVKHGTAGTMKEAKFYAESQITNHAQGELPF